MLISKHCKCGKNYSVEAKDHKTQKAITRSMVKAEFELSDLIQECDCDFKKPEGFKHKGQEDE